MTATLCALSFTLLGSAASTGCSRPNPKTETTNMNPTTAASVEDMPIACRMNALTKEERERSRALRTELTAAITEKRALPNGLSFTWRPDALTFEKAAEWITLERRCCPFLAFDLQWLQGDESAPWLTLTGPKGTREFLAAEMPELPIEQ
jgi:hypothetical protein